MDQAANVTGIDSSHVEALSYVEFVALIEETNRPPGGLRTVLDLANVCNVGPGSRVLDVGCNTGFVALELAAIRRCRVTGLDLSPRMIEVARGRSEERGLDGVDFVVGDATAQPFPADTFDAVFCGGSLAFVSDAGRAIREMARVLRPGGFLCDAEFFYGERRPPHRLLMDLEAILGFPIPDTADNRWLSLYAAADLELVSISTRAARSVVATELERWVDIMVARIAHRFTARGANACRRRLATIMEVFNENHDYLQYSSVVCRKRAAGEDPALFI